MRWFLLSGESQRVRFDAVLRQLLEHGRAASIEVLVKSSWVGVVIYIFMMILLMILIDDDE